MGKQDNLFWTTEQILLFEPSQATKSQNCDVSVFQLITLQKNKWRGIQW